MRRTRLNCHRPHRKEVGCSDIKVLRGPGSGAVGVHGPGSPLIKELAEVVTLKLLVLHHRQGFIVFLFQVLCGTRGCLCHELRRDAGFSCPLQDDKMQVVQIKPQMVYEFRLECLLIVLQVFYIRQMVHQRLSRSSGSFIE